jgi:hypothetical protein
MPGSGFKRHGSCQQSVSLKRGSCFDPVWIGRRVLPKIVFTSNRGGAMFYRSMGRVHAATVGQGERIRGRLAAEGGQGTVEYVGLILLVSLLMVGMLAAMKGFSGRQGTELAELIVDKIQTAVDKVTFR